MRGITTMPTQALTLLNSSFVRGQAAKFASLLMAEFPKETVPDAREALEKVFQNAFARRPLPAELERFGAFLKAQMADKNTRQALEAALAQVSRILLCSNEFIYID
jgi:alkylhydroperoxidase family enzyme